MKNKKVFFIPLLLTFFLSGCLAPVVEGENGNDNGNGNNQENGNGNNENGNGNGNGNGEGTNTDDNGNGDNTNTGENGDTNTDNKVDFPLSALKSFCQTEGITTEIPVPATQAEWTTETRTQEMYGVSKQVFVASAPDADKAILNAYHTKMSALTDWNIAATPETADSYYGSKDNASIGYMVKDGVFQFGLVKIDEQPQVDPGTVDPDPTNPDPGTGDVDPTTPEEPDPTTPVDPNPVDPVDPDPVNPDPGTDPVTPVDPEPTEPETPSENHGLSQDDPLTPAEAIALCDEAGSGNIVGGDKLYYVQGTFDTGTTVNTKYTPAQWYGTLSGTQFKVSGATNDSGVKVTESNGAMDGKEVIVCGYIELYNNEYKVGYLPASASPTGQKFVPSIISIKNGSTGGDTPTPSNTAFPATALQSFLTSQGYTTTVPSPVSNGEWGSTEETDDDFGYSFIAWVEDSGTIGTNSIEDTYKDLLLQNSWEVDDTYYDADGYYAWKDGGDVALLFYTYDGEFDLYVFSIDALSGSSQTLPEDNDPTFEGPETPNAKAEWTLMFYVCGADLESGSGRYATLDIEEIVTTAGKPDNVNIVFETGGCYDWADTYNIKSTRLSRFHVENGNLVNDAQLELDSMGKPETLQSFLEWGMTYYPAEKYGVFMWNHGGGMDGCEFDEIFNNDCLTLTEFNEAVTSAKTTCGVDKLEFVAYDACLMAIQDIASLNASNFNYMLSSQESESGFGYDYDAWLPSLYNNPAAIGTADLLEEIGHTFLEEEAALFAANNWGASDQTQSVYDLSKMAAYQAAFEEVVTGLQSSVNSSSKWSTFVSNNIKTNGVQKYGVDDDGNYLYDIYDAEDVLDKIAANYSSLASKVQAAKEALHELVVYEEHGSGTSGCGLNIFCPTEAQYNRYVKTDTTFSIWWDLCNYSGLCLESYE